MRWSSLRGAGVLVTVGGLDGEPYASGHPLTGTRAGRLRAE
ncbi:hypothetical protein [Streptomyces hiroshimensis]|nr:hypothetical protein [Streptomyces hiroshimensis]